MTQILVAVISGVVTLLGTIITVISTNSKTRKDIEVNQAVFNTKLEELTREVRIHNGFAQRIPVVEEKVERLEKEFEKLD